MKRPLAKIVTSEFGRKYLDWAEHRLLVIAKQRELIGIPFLKKVYTFNNIIIKIISHNAFDKIIILGGGGLWHIYFVGNGVPDFAINPFNDSTKISSFELDSSNVHQQFSGRIQAFSNYVELSSRGFSGGDEVGRTTYVGPIQSIAASVYALDVNNLLYLSQYDDFEYTVTTNTFLPALTWTSANFANIVVPHYENDSWNLISTIHNWFIPNWNSAPIDNFTWYPSFYYMEPMNAQVPTGWYYGRPITPYIGDPFLPLSGGEEGIHGEVDFGGFLKQRSSGLEYYAFGYYEIVKSLNLSASDPAYGATFPKIVFFTAGAPDTASEATAIITNYYETVYSIASIAQYSNDQLHGEITVEPPVGEYQTWFNWRSNVLLSQASMRGGTTPSGTAGMFTVLESPFGELPDVIEWWAFQGHATERSCLLMTKGTNIALYQTTTTGFSSPFFESNEYISHSISHDGTYVAIFTGEEGIITNYSLFEMYGGQTDITIDTLAMPKDRAIYAGGVAVIKDNENITSFGPMLEASIIPNNLPGTVFGTLKDKSDKNMVQEQETGLNGPAMGALQWQRDGASSLTIDKMWIEDGIHGFAKTVLDECFDSVIYIDLPTAPLQDKMVTKWGTGGSPLDLYNGLIRGSFVGDRFQGETQTGYNISTVTLPETFDIEEQLDGTLQFPGHVGTLEIGSCIKEVDGAYYPDDDCVPDCENGEFTYTMTATSSCGQTADRQKEVTVARDPVSVQISGTLDIQVGDIVAGNGGWPPYTVSASGITFADDDGGEVLSIDACAIPGSPRYTTITATDSCGNTGELQVRLPGGAWVMTSLCSSYAACGSEYCVVTCRYVVGDAMLGGFETHYGGVLSEEPIPLNNGCAGYVPCNYLGCGGNTTMSVDDYQPYPISAAICNDLVFVNGYTNLYVTEISTWEYQCP